MYNNLDSSSLGRGYGNMHMYMETGLSTERLLLPHCFFILNKLSLFCVRLHLWDLSIILKFKRKLPMRL